MKYLLYFIISLGLGSISLLTIIQNPIHSLLLLINFFVLKTILLLIVNVEFLGLIFFMVYIGAIVVLFLFVVMMIDLKINATSIIEYSPLTLKALVVNLLIINLVFILNKDNALTILNHMFTLLPTGDYWSPFVEWYNFFELIDKTTHLEAIGFFLFTTQIFAFISAGILLYIAMIGAIILTIDKKGAEIIKRQNASIQTMRRNIIKT